MASQTKAETDALTGVVVRSTQTAREAMPAAWAWCWVAVKTNLLFDLAQLVLDYVGKDAATELFVQFRQSAREAMPAAWAWCRVATRTEFLFDLSQIVLDYAGFEDTELSADDGNQHCLSLFARTTNSCLFRIDDIYMACYMPLVGLVRVARSEQPGAWCTLTLNLNSVISPAAVNYVKPEIIEAAVPSLAWSRQQHAGVARVLCRPAFVQNRTQPFRCCVSHASFRPAGLG